MKPLSSPFRVVVKTPVIALEADGDFGRSKGRRRWATTRLSNIQAVSLNGSWFHLELFEVDEEGNAKNPALQADVNAVTTLCGERPAAMEIGGKHYITVLFPHAR